MTLFMVLGTTVGDSAICSVSGGFVSFEHRGFRVTANAVADELGVQWVCHAVIERTGGNKEKGAPADIELIVPRAKIDPFMAISALEHRARTAIDDWHERGPA
jgi:hypothetical protein